MFMTTTYKGLKDGVIGYYCGFKPNNIEIIEEMPILNAEEGFELVRISNGENVGSSVWLHNGDVQENYREESSEEESI
jgi:hypothetical protein